MSGGQGGGCRFGNALNLLMNLERPTTCRYHIPYVVGYVVAYMAPSCILATLRTIFFAKLKFTKPENCRIIETQKEKYKFCKVHNAAKAPEPECSRTWIAAITDRGRTQETCRVSNKSSDSGVLLTMKRLSSSLPDGPLLTEGPWWAQSSNRGGYS
jgi:hypothetical protein